LTYPQASAVLEGKTGRMSKPVVKLVCEMEKLAKAIEKRRLADGMIELDLPEVDLVFDEAGRVTGVRPADTSYSHKIIEMFMIEANEAVARLLVSKKVPHLRRVHPAPDAAAGENLSKFLRAIGLGAPELEDRLAVQSLLRSVRNKPQSFAVNLAILRSMQRAEYAPTLIGHFALASDDYSHFTSPIRRYPDLTVHRLLDDYVAGRLEGKGAVADQPSTSELKELGGHCSHQERRAEAAERELRLIKILRLLEDRVGEELAGVVTGVANFGIFVQLNEFHVDGLMKFDDLGDDWWEVDTTRGCVVGQRSGKRLSIGQSVKVAIAKVDISGRQLDLVLAGVVDSGGGKSPSKSRGHSRVTKVKRSVKKSPARRKGAKSRRSATTRRATKSRGRR
jgi:ribonuclease R